MAQGSLALVLHAHLPYVRHPEHDDFLEERWLFEAMAESHLPLLDALWRWRDEGLAARLTLSCSPTLAAMWRDPLLQSRFARHLDRVDALLAGERSRHANESATLELIALHQGRVDRARRVWAACDRDPYGAFAALAADGAIELWTTAATHAFLPGLAHHPWMLRAQVDLGVASARAMSGHAPQGFWLPECGYTPEAARALRRAGVSRTVVESHGVLHASPRPAWATAAPVVTPDGLVVFGRDSASAREVWSRDVGFPGDPWYRDYHRDLGHTLPLDALEGFVAADGTRLRTGVGYWRVTDRRATEKARYEPDAARKTLEAHARRFVRDRREAVAWHRARGLEHPLMVCPYDAELFGHWWFEGVDFLDAMFRALRDEAPELDPVTLGAWRANHPDAERAEPAPSSWGDGGFARVWLDPSNAWMLRPVDRALTEVRRVLRAYRGDPTRRGVLAEAVREAMLLVSSDWAFLVRTGAAPHYARARFEAHRRRVEELVAMCEGAHDENARRRASAGHPLLPDVDLDALTIDGE